MSCLAWHETPVEVGALGRKSGELHLSIRVGSSFEVEPTDSTKAIGDMSLDRGSIKSCLSIGTSYSQFQRAGTGSAIHDGDLFVVRLPFRDRQLMTSAGRGEDSLGDDCRSRSSSVPASSVFPHRDRSGCNLGVCLISQAPWAAGTVRFLPCRFASRSCLSCTYISWYRACPADLCISCNRRAHRAGWPYR